MSLVHCTSITHLPSVAFLPNYGLTAWFMYLIMLLYIVLLEPVSPLICCNYILSPLHMCLCTWTTSRLQFAAFLNLQCRCTCLHTCLHTCCVAIFLVFAVLYCPFNLLMLPGDVAFIPYSFDLSQSLYCIYWGLSNWVSSLMHSFAYHLIAPFITCSSRQIAYRCIVGLVIVSRWCIVFVVGSLLFEPVFEMYCDYLFYMLQSWVSCNGHVCLLHYIVAMLVHFVVLGHHVSALLTWLACSSMLPFLYPFC